MLNCGGNKDSNKKCGSDAIQNRFMYLTSNFVLEKIKPKVFIFENAPNLFTNVGKGVFENLCKIAEKYDYSFSLIKTTTYLHNIPQNRQRTFGFFWKSKYAPIINWYKSNTLQLKDYLKNIPENCTLHDINKTKENFKNDILIKYFIENKISFNEIYNKGYKTLFYYIFSENKYEEVLKYLKNNNDEVITKRLIFAKNKLDKNLGYWDSSPLLYKNYTNAIISKNMFRSILIDENRFLTIREYMSLMGLPYDFQIDEKQVYTITQNVPVNTAQDMIKECVKFINGELKFSNSKILKQNNINQTIEYFNQTSKKSFINLIGK